MAGVLKRGQRVLLVQRGAQEKVFPNLWEFPSGKKELGEDCFQALKREFFEEVNLCIKPIAVLSVFDYVVNKGDERRETTQINFLVKLQVGKKGTPSLSTEHQDYKWVTQKDLTGLHISKATKKVLSLAFSNK